MGDRDDDYDYPRLGDAPFRSDPVRASAAHCLFFASSSSLPAHTAEAHDADRDTLATGFQEPLDLFSDDEIVGTVPANARHHCSTPHAPALRFATSI